jgi:hypothetical protein
METQFSIPHENVISQNPVSSGLFSPERVVSKTKVYILIHPAGF